LWTITEIIARATQGFAVSLLEITVLAYAACAVVVYAIYWRKPKNIRTAMAVLEYLDDIPKPELSASQTELGNENFASYLFFAVTRDSDVHRPSKHPAGSPISPLALHAIVSKSASFLPGMAIPIVGYAAKRFLERFISQHGTSLFQRQPIKLPGDALASMQPCLAPC
jgi:hypothetical protein